jgi:pilus assembly protein Flp/PilA
MVLSATWQTRSNKALSSLGGARASILEEKPVMRRFLKDESGLELSEYAVAAALVTLAVIVAFTSLGTNINGVIGNLASKIK